MGWFGLLFKSSLSKLEMFEVQEKQLGQHVKRKYFLRSVVYLFWRVV